MGENGSSRNTDRSDTRKSKFLEAYSTCGTVLHAANSAGIARQTHYQWLKDDAAYAERFKLADQDAIESLEHEARRRAVDGIEEAIYDKQGKLVRTITKYSDTLLIFLLKGALPDKYKDRWHSDTPQKHEHTHKFDLNALTPDEQREFRNTLAKLAGRGGSAVN